jgi:hypothetical protein
MRNIFDIIKEKVAETPKPEPQANQPVAKAPAGVVSAENLKKAIIEANPHFISGNGRATPYLDLAFEEYTRVVKPLEQQLKDLEAKQGELSERWHEASKSGNTVLAEVINKNKLDLKAREKEAQKQLSMARTDYQPDLGLVFLAKELDAADATNNGLQLVMQIQGQLEDILPLIDRAAMCYQGEPRILTKVRENVSELLRAFNGGSGPSGLRQVNKTETETRFNEALAAYKKQIEQKEEARRFTFAM